MKSIIDYKFSKWKKENVTIVTNEYKKESNSIVSGVVLEDGYIFDKSSDDDINYARWIENTIGGKITVKKKIVINHLLTMIWNTTESLNNGKKRALQL